MISVSVDILDGQVNLIDFETVFYVVFLRYGTCKLFFYEMKSNSDIRNTETASVNEPRQAKMCLRKFATG